MVKGRGILFDPETGDLRIEVRRNAPAGQISAGLQIGDVMGQNQTQLLMLHPGELKADPLIGVGISDILLDQGNMLYWRTRVRQAFEADGMKIKILRFDSPDEMIIDAAYVDGN